MGHLTTRFDVARLTNDDTGDAVTNVTVTPNENDENDIEKSGK
jgi:hypothetical protein